MTGWTPDLDRELLRLHDAENSPQTIAGCFGMRAGAVEYRLRKLGAVPRQGDDPHERKMAAWKRARDGVRATLEGLQ